jgi:hypothetical protein
MHTRIAAFSVLALLSGAAPSLALAQPVSSATRASARLLAEEGLALSDRGDCAGAVEKLTRAHELVKMPTLALFAGNCMVKLGRWVDASEMYLAATRDEVEPGAPAAQRRAQEDAAAARAALLPRIPTVELVLDAAAAGASVTLAGLGVKRPIDPGKHVVEVKRGGAVTTRELVVEEATHERFVLALPAGVGPVEAPAKSEAVPEAPSPGPWVVGGVGVAGLVVGAVAGVVMLIEYNVAAPCSLGPPPTCPRDVTAAANKASSVGRVAGPVTTVGLVVGGVGVAAGGLWLGLRPSSRGAARVGVASVAGGAVWRVERSW